jgi:DMSO/TMAO reductase YedYZ molybdopterin-dependent catalytic subunit
VSESHARKTSRRTLLRRSLLSGLHKLRWPQAVGSDSASQGSLAGVVPFSGEGRLPMNEPLGAELDGRLFTDLSTMAPENAVTPTDHFYIRTRASKLLDASKPWSIQFGGLIEKPAALSTETLRKMAEPMGLHLMECAGNFRDAHFGMISVADWHGVLLRDILETTEPTARATRVLISGFDQYTLPSKTSVPGASWIFTPDELQSSGAFLATR